MPQIRYGPVREEMGANPSMTDGFYELMGAGIFFALLIILYKDSLFILNFTLKGM
ncbi:MAG TPA: hypothetical protein VNM22_08835 [Candidatus Limnocylindrales bacterium]|nr:hypothetical protein [Candidatus Limnocylindrales bacterium]